MVGIAIRFELGCYHSTPWESHVNDATVEWPPSPWRILRALYAISRTNVEVARRRPAIDAALGLLARARPPSYELPAASASHTRHYMPSRLHSPSAQGKTDKVLDGFLVVDPSAELVAWWEAELDHDQLEGLEAAVCALGYLGRSESVCSARVVVASESGELAAVPVVESDPATSGELVRLLCPVTDDPLEALSISVTQLRRRRLLTPPGTEWVDYTLLLPARPQPPSAFSGRPTLARFRIRGGARPGMREAVAVADAVRAALQARYGRRNDEESSAVFSGRAGDAPRADQHRHAHYLVTPDADGRRVDHVVVWAPEGFGPEEVAALADLTEVRMWRAPEPLRLALAALGDPEQMRLPGLLGPAHVWRSLTPFGLSRHPKIRGGRVIDGPVDQIRREIAIRGLPDTADVVLLRGPWLEYRRSRPRRSRLDASRAVGARIVFPEPVLGPLALGALSHFGLGLFVPER
ncbi:MAG: type I-G CRISPR-associated protein Csb2 [Solirubrobacteraceae bacterium]